ncbi:MAG: hypothetical protein HC850_02070 [Rhodomicrobium sp.]|nr:hypothetical protein [Rhodomicrobium sp.]
MHRLEELAWASVARGCGFAALGIFTFMVGMSGNMPLAFKAGGILTLLTSLILLAKGLHAPQRFYKHTEVWLMLEPNDRPHAALAQTLIGQALRRTYLTFALHTALLACGFFAVSLVLALFLVGGIG